MTAHQARLCYCRELLITNTTGGEVGAWGNHVHQAGKSDRSEFEAACDAPEEVAQLLTQREEARKRKDWAEADRLRAEITAAGYRMEDSPQGPKLKKI